MACLRLLVGLLALSSFVPAASASTDDWAEKLFSTRQHDFGTVARNARAEFVFEMENQYAVDVHVAGVRTSCGCTTPSIVKDALTTYEKGGIRAVFNTGSFTGKHGATITVTFDKPRFAEVQLRVEGQIRGEVNLQPGGLEFGNVPQGSSARQQLRIEYLGVRRPWSITEVRSNHPHLKFQLQPLNSATGGGSYQLTADLAADAPAGYLLDQVVLVTNDPTLPQLPVAITGRVVPAVTVSPSNLFLGVLTPGQQVQRRLVVMGPRPFRVTRIDSESCFQFQLDDTARKVHLIPLTFTAGETLGKLDRTVQVHTDLDEGLSASCSASAAIVPAESPGT